MANDFQKLQKDIHSVSEKEWQKRGEKAALRVFREAAKTVPAYKKFLKKHNIDPASIKTITDFKQVPLMTKENYLKAYPLNELLPEGTVGAAQMISTSSGSTGIPYFWPRGAYQEAESSLIHELLLTEFFHIDTKRTLFVNTFAMGMWVAGTTTYDSVSRIAEKYGMTVITPGIEFEQILSAIEHLAHHYEQIIIAGYPPFVKDIIDLGFERGIEWDKLSVRFLFAAESFSEKWREHIHSMVKTKDPLFGSLNIYGTADALIVAHETPLSVLIRQLIIGNTKLHRAMFGRDHRIPTFTQYDPTRRYFEELPDSKLIFTSQSGIPLIRYDIGDTGNIFNFNDIDCSLTEGGVDLTKEIAQNKLNGHVWNFPFVSIYGRDRMTTSLYGLKIYPEHIRGALEQRVVVECTTGRFVMGTKTDKKKNQYLELNIELNAKIKKSDKTARHLSENIIKHLRVVNGEYRRLHDALGERAAPKVILHPHLTSAFFSRKGKQQWKV
jgi:phenylacetate-CoA ligase